MRYAVLVDAGYFYAALATRISGSSYRGAVKVNEEQFISRLLEQVEAECGADLLRVLWYDGARDGMPDSDQRRIGNLDGVKLRMGRINTYGEQKGVDLRLGLDLLLMAVNRTIEFAYVISGDDDLTEAVEDAQQLGLRVKVLAVPQAGHDAVPFAVAKSLALAADGVLLIDPKHISESVTEAPSIITKRVAEAPVKPAIPTPATIAKAQRSGAKITPSVQPQPQQPITSHELVYSSAWQNKNVHEEYSATIPVETIEEVARQAYTVWHRTATEQDIFDLSRNRPSIPPEVDRILLADLANTCNIYDVPLWARQELRAMFWAAVDKLS